MPWHRRWTASEAMPICGTRPLGVHSRRWLRIDGPCSAAVRTVSAIASLGYIRPRRFCNVRSSSAAHLAA